MHSDDTIVAISSAAGPAARMIVRTSGPSAIDCLASIIADVVPNQGGVAFRSLVRFAGVIVPAWVYLFRSPASYTGEDLVEYHLPGNPLLAEMILRHLQAQGLRQAEPGEFTARAYFNGRIDLTQAEGVAATVSAQSEQQLLAGRRLMAGELARRLAEPTDLILSTLALLEVGIDFSDEDVSFLSPNELQSRITASRDALRALLNDSERFKPLGHEPSFVLVGRPNAGKSTLLNALAGYERAVASPAAGTTRDALVADVALLRGFVRVIDVAGLEDGSSQSIGATSAAADIARQMAERAASEIARADFVLLLLATDDPLPPLNCKRQPDLTVRSKSDLPADAEPVGSEPVVISVSAISGEGLQQLRQAMDDLAFGRVGANRESLALNLRHVQAVEAAIASLDQALTQHHGAIELIAADLREALAQVGAVVGQVSPDELLGRIFSQFCIGK